MVSLFPKHTMSEGKLLGFSSFTRRKFQGRSTKHCHLSIAYTLDISCLFELRRYFTYFVLLNAHASPPQLFGGTLPPSRWTGCLFNIKMSSNSWHQPAHLCGGDRARHIIKTLQCRIFPAIICAANRQPPYGLTGPATCSTVFAKLTNWTHTPKALRQSCQLSRASYA